MALTDKLSAIGDAIRAKTGKEEKLTLDQMPLEISEISCSEGTSGFPIEIDTLDNALLTAENDGKVYKCEDKLYQVNKITSLKGLTIKFNEHITPCPLVGTADYFKCNGTAWVTLNEYYINNFDDIDEHSFRIGSIHKGMCQDIYEHQVIIFTVSSDNYGGVSYLSAGSGYEAGWYKILSYQNYEKITSEGFTITEFDCPELNENQEFIDWVFDNTKVDGIYVFNELYTEMGSNGVEWFNDGNTHLWISLSEGRTSPMVGVCPNGTVTVDWGDGTTPDVLTGTSTTEVKFTPNHHYAEAGDYVITLSVDGEMGINYENGILIHSTNIDDMLNYYAYNFSLKKAEIGNDISLGNTGFGNSSALTKVATRDAKNISRGAFSGCLSLTSIIIFDGATEIGEQAFYSCFSLTSITIPDSVTKIGKWAFVECGSLASVTIPRGVTELGDGVFGYCFSLAFVDFTQHTVVPTIGNNTFGTDGIPEDFEIRVPAALVDEWKTASNWSAYADYIVGV